MAESNWTPIVVVTGGAAITALVIMARQRKAPPDPKRKLPLSQSGDITSQFTAAIPEITPEVNLELATATQTETFTHASAKTLWGMIDLGTSTVQIRVPVTYRYHVCLREAWRLEIRGRRVVVMAPPFKASQPPAIHTDGLEKLSVRGWARGGTTEQMEQLQRAITPTVSRQAEDERHLELVRNQCRRSVAEFVRIWLEREGSWSAREFTEIEVRFPREVRGPESILRLGDGEK